MMHMTPSVGNLLINALAWKDGTSATTPTMNTASWTEYARVSNAGIPQLIGNYRYVQSGDTATLASVATAGSEFESQIVCEITGVSGTWASDFVSEKHARQSSGTSFATTSDSAPNNSLTLIMVAVYSASTAVSAYTNGFLEMKPDVSGSYGATGTAALYSASSGSVSTTMTIQSDPAAYIQTIFIDGSGGGGGGGGGGGSAPSYVLVIT